MFRTSLIEERSGLPWGVIAGCIAFATLIVSGYILVT